MSLSNPLLTDDGQARIPLEYKEMSILRNVLSIRFLNMFTQWHFVRSAIHSFWVLCTHVGFGGTFQLPVKNELYSCFKKGFSCSILGPISDLEQESSVSEVKRMSSMQSFSLLFSLRPMFVLPLLLHLFKYSYHKCTSYLSYYLTLVLQGNTATVIFVVIVHESFELPQKTWLNPSWISI